MGLSSLALMEADETLKTLWVGQVTVLARKEGEFELRARATIPSLSLPFLFPSPSWPGWKRTSETWVGLMNGAPL